jgi:uncharacterized protein (DUF934 family)
MTLLRREGVVEGDPWITVADDAPIPDGDVIVTLARWRNERDTIRGRSGRVGVRVAGDTDPEELAPELEGVSLVAVEFPKFSDGRGYSLARLLVSRGGFTGELRAVGNVLRDQLFYMLRCGFTSFELDPKKDPSEALEAFREITLTYQPAEDHDLPIWRRRASEERTP